MFDYDLLVVGSANADLVIGVEGRPRAGAGRLYTKHSPPDAALSR